MRAAAIDARAAEDATEPIVVARRIAIAIAAGFVVVVALVLATVGLPSSVAYPLDAAQQVVSIAVGLAVLLGVAVRHPGQVRRQALLQVLAIATVGAAMCAWYAGEPAHPPVITDMLLVVGSGILILSLIPTVYRGLDLRSMAVIGLDAAILFGGVAAVALRIWSPEPTRLASAGMAAPSVAAVMLIAGAVSGCFALMVRRVPFTFGGPWSVLAGTGLAGASWVVFLQLLSEGRPTVATPADFMVSLGILLVAHGAATWSVTRSASPRYLAITDRLAAGFPLATIALVVALTMLPDARRPGVMLATALVVAAGIARMAFLIHSEREMVRQLADEQHERADTAISLGRLRPGEDAAATARSICIEALRVAGARAANLAVLGPDGAILPIAHEPASVAAQIPPAPTPERIALVRDRARAGAWLEYVSDDTTGHLAPLASSGIVALAHAPLQYDDEMLGLFTIEVGSQKAAESLARRLATVREFGVVASALLGPMLAERDRQDFVRAAVSAEIEAGAFHPVYQPIVELATGRVAGHEALTRFDSGARPDLRFADASAVGMGPALESATLRAAIAGATHLAAGTWLNVNVSPAMVGRLVPLVAALESADRDIVLEITEHTHIEDYAPLMAMLGSVRGRLRLAVDDAGAGYASLRHILELRPDFVKLDIGLVRAIDRDPARRALVASLVGFAQETGCLLIAEGIETSTELATLRDLGVHFGQGYLLGRPLTDSAAPAAC